MQICRSLFCQKNRKASLYNLISDLKFSVGIRESWPVGEQIADLDKTPVAILGVLGRKSGFT